MIRSLLTAAAVLTSLSAAARADVLQVRVDGIEVTSDAIMSVSPIELVTRRDGSTRPAPVRFERAFDHGDDLYAWAVDAMEGSLERRDVVLARLDDTYSVVEEVTLEGAYPCQWALPAFGEAVETFSLCARGATGETDAWQFDADADAPVEVIQLAVEGVDLIEGEVLGVQVMDTQVRPNGAVTVSPVVLSRTVADDALRAWYEGDNDARSVGLTGLDGDYVGARAVELSGATVCDWVIADDGETETITLCVELAVEQ